MEMKKHYSLIAGILTVSLLSSGIVPALAGTVEEIERRTHKASIFPDGYERAASPDSNRPAGVGRGHWRGQREHLTRPECGQKKD